MKHSILVSKQGAVFRTRAEMRTASAAGEQGETEGVIRHLLTRNDLNVVYFGKYRGEPLPGLTVVESDTRELSELSSGSEQDDCFRRDARALEEHAPFVGAITIAGQPPTFSTINNPRGASIQACAVHYTAPILAAIQHFKLQRIVINNDPRTYPRDQEMSYGWDYVRPAALLDQCEASVKQTVGGKPYIRRSVYARVEGWCHHEPERRIWDEKSVDVCCIAHAHIYDGCAKGSPNPWSIVFDNEAQFTVWGKGWERHPQYDPEFMPGPLKPTEVRSLVSESRFCPVVAHTPGFYTGKVYVLESLGCMPLLYGNGSSPWTWDHREEYVSLCSDWRVVGPRDIDRIVNACHKDTSIWYAMREHWHNATRPCWNMLDHAVDDLIERKRLDPILYGGYVPC